MSEHPSFSNLKQLLVQERLAIISGDFKAIDALSIWKEELFDNLPKNQRNAKNLEEIRVALDRNQNLLKAAISGVTSARSRLIELSDVREKLRVYDQSGRFSAHASTRPELNKRT